MKTVQIEFSKYELVNFLWPELIEEYGFDKARKIVSQAIDLQKMNGTKNSTMPIIFSGTGGLALISTCNDLKKDLNLTDGDVVDMLQLVMDRFKNSN